MHSQFWRFGLNEIHGAQIESGVFIDEAGGLVIGGETAVVEGYAIPRYLKSGTGKTRRITRLVEKGARFRPTLR